MPLLWGELIFMPAMSIIVTVRGDGSDPAGWQSEWAPPNQHDKSQTEPDADVDTISSASSDANALVRPRIPELDATPDFTVFSI
jgi:hypothetical protein